MKILAIESATQVASCCILSDDLILAEITTNFKKTHSETLLPMIDELMKVTGLTPSEMDAFTSSVGPGSFTGLRIGAATVKGLSFATGKPLVPVSTIEALAYNFYGSEYIICPLMDARRNQVYTALFTMKDKTFVRLTEDEPKDLFEQMALAENFAREMNRPIVYLGDGVQVYQKQIEERSTVSHLFAPAHMLHLRASSVAVLAKEKFEKDETVSAEAFLPVYLRKSQAEQEREEKGLPTE